MPRNPLHSAFFPVEAPSTGSRFSPVEFASKLDATSPNPATGISAEKFRKISAMTDLAHFAALMDCLHEAAFVPEGWAAALDKLSALAG
jgi:hypothetical protein